MFYDPVDGGDDEINGKAKTRLTRADGTPLGNQGQFHFEIACLGFVGTQLKFSCVILVADL